MHSTNLYTSNLARQSRILAVSVKQVVLIRTTASQTGGSLAVGLVPARELLVGDSVWVLAVVEALDQSRRLHVAAANVEGPRDQRAVLVVIESGGDGVGEAVLELLWSCGQSCVAF